MNQNLEETNLDEVMPKEAQLEETASEADPVEEEKPKKKRKKLHPAISFLIAIVIAIAGVILLNHFVVVNAVVPTGSMEETILPGERVLGLRIIYFFKDPARGDIVVFHNPDNRAELYVKRVIGLPGETLEVIDGVVYINGEALEEPYINKEYGNTTSLAAEDYGPYQIPEGSYFMMGDNRGNSRDARFWENTYITEKDMVGNVFWRYWPVNHTGAVK